MTGRLRIPDPEISRLVADPTRRRVLDALLAAPEPITVAAITDSVGVHHNAIRHHLAQLVDAGLAIETREHRTTPGRPRLLYRAAPTAPANASDHYRRLARLLLRAVQTGASARDVGRQAGAEEADGSRDGGDPIAALQRDNARLGFMPTRVERDGRIELVLNRCPIADLAAADRTTICSLHRGLAEGFLEATGGARVTNLIAMDPYRAGCTIRIARESR